MSNSWDDFKTDSKVENKKEEDEVPKNEEGVGCDWGFTKDEDGADEDDIAAGITDASKFCKIYENYLSNKDSIHNETKNNGLYKSNPARALHEWFENEDLKLSIKTEQTRGKEHLCSLDIPVGDHDFSIASEIHEKKQDAVNEVCFIACKLLDEAQLLYPWQSSTKEEEDRKRRFDEANKEDDIELDNTIKKRQRDSLHSNGDNHTSTTPKVNTYESLLARWNELNASILQLKAKLVRLDLSLTQQAPKKKQSEKNEADGSDDEIDPLDEFMSNIDNKTKLTMDEKIAKSRIKSQIVAYERDQGEVSRLIDLAKPKFDLNKACPSKSASVIVKR